tara:strand:+ start:81 stop:704 length:624 start_codon:yes stop_codon:yes gene_type:complete
MLTPSVDNTVVTMDEYEQHDAEIRLMGLILAQSILVAVAVGIFSSGVWLPGGSGASDWVNGLTYGMGALAVQVLAYYVFKMFFEQQMKERVRMTNIERQRNYKYRNMQQSFDHRRAEMEIRLQEAQLERELRWMEANPGKMPPSWGVQGGGPSIIGAFDAKQNERFDSSKIPTHEAENQSPVNLGITGDIPLTKDGKPDKRYLKKGE